MEEEVEFPEPPPPLNDDELTVNETMTHEEKIAVQIEIARRQRAIRIKFEMEKQTVDVMKAKKLQQKIWRSGTRTRNVQPPSAQLQDYPRSREVRDYLFRNIRELALDTMNFRMPEHVLYGHIVRHGGIQLTADEWRSFLEVMSANKTLF